MTDIRMSGPTLKVLKLLLDNLQHGQSGAEISMRAKVGSGTLYPLLMRLEGAGWAKGTWEKGEPRDLGRPRRRFYKLTGAGQRHAQKALNELQTGTGALQWNT